jgi:hypothetical protein
MAYFAAFFNKQSPFKHDVFRDLKNPARKHGPYGVRKPVGQDNAIIRVSGFSIPKRISANVTELT